MTTGLVIPAHHRFIDADVLRRAYLRYDESRSPDAPPHVCLEAGLELGIVSSHVPDIALAVSSLLTRSLEGARCDRGGHLPPEVVARVQRDIISPAGVAGLWGTTGHRFVLSCRASGNRRQILATTLVGRSKDTVFFFSGRYNNLRHSTMATVVDFDQPDTLGGDPSRRWFDRFAFPEASQFKPDRYHHIANFVVGLENRREGLAKLLLDSIVRYYSKDHLANNNLPIEHSQFLLCGKGFWQIGDPPWLARMQRLGFYLRWGAESFFIEHDWARLPTVTMGGKLISNLAYNKMYGLPACYAGGQQPHPSSEHLLDRIPEVLRLASDPRAKLQYFQALLDFT